MDIYGKRGDGSVFVQDNAKGAVLPRESVVKEEYSGSIKVIESFKGQQSEIRQNLQEDDLAPDRPFSETLNAVNKDPRLNLSNETYVQMIIAKGFRVTCKNKTIEDDVMDWLNDMMFDEFLEDTVYSYCGVGNMIWEHDSTYTNWVEVPMPTIETLVRNNKGKIIYYKQRVNDRDLQLKPKNISHFKLTNVAQESFARGLHHSVLSRYENPDDNEIYDSPLIQMKKMEDAMPKIFNSYASPLMMFHFEDAGEQFIKTQADQLQKAKPGMKIVTDKKFDVEVFEVAAAGKFDSYIEHIQRDLIEPGSKFPLQFFNAGFTARAASESTESVLMRKVKRIQTRLANQVMMFMILPYIKFGLGKKIKRKDIQGFFDTPTKAEATIVDVLTSYRDNAITRSEFRKWAARNTTIDIDENDMEDLPPITSVTPTDQLQDTREEPKKVFDSEDEKESLQESVNELKQKLQIREELDSSDKRKNTKEILEFIRSIN